MLPEQWRFVAARLNTRTDKEAAQEIGLHPSTVSKWPNKKEIDDLILSWLASSASASKSVMEQQVLKAAMVMLALLDSDDERIRIDAAKNILDRVNGKAPQRNINEHSGKDGDDLRIVIEYADTDA